MAAGVGGCARLEEPSTTASAPALLTAATTAGLEPRSAIHATWASGSGQHRVRARRWPVRSEKVSTSPEVSPRARRGGLMEGQHTEREKVEKRKFIHYIYSCKAALAKQYKTKQNKTKQNKTKKNIFFFLKKANATKPHLL
jgi:hypothetical protein